jgi:hypothetical protein
MHETVFLLWHTHRIDSTDSEKLIGVYTSEELAEEAKRRMVILPGFKDCPDGFEVVPALLNKDSWEDGYVTYTF